MVTGRMRPRPRPATGSGDVAPVYWAALESTKFPNKFVAAQLGGATAAGPVAEAGHGRPRLVFPRMPAAAILLTALGFGFTTGLIEVTAHLVRRYGLGRILAFGTDFVWMTPLANALVFLLHRARSFSLYRCRSGSSGRPWWSTRYSAPR